MKPATVIPCREGEIQVFCHHTNLLDPQGLIPHRDNNNIHSSEQVDIMKAIIKVTGWREPIVVSEKTLRIVSGHLRAAVAMEMGMEKVPVDIQFFEDDLAEVRHLTADNEIARLAQFDVEKFNKTKAKFKKAMGRNQFQTSFFNPHEWGLAAYPVIGDKDPKEKTPVEMLLKDGDKWLLGPHILVVEKTTPENEVYLQKFLKGWKKAHGVAAIHNETSQSFDEVMDERRNK